MMGRKRRNGDGAAPAARRALAAWIVVAAVAAVANLGPARAARGGSLDQEAQIKSTYLLHFAKLVAWPATVGPADSRFLIGVVGDPYLWRECRRALVGKKVDERRVAVISLSYDDALAPPPGLRMLYVAGCDSAALATLLAAMGDRPILLVGDEPGFCDQGGTIGLLHQEDAIRFEINRGQERRAGLAINSRLLQIAHRVIG